MITFSVTAKDIREGRRLRSEHCPVAVAIRRRLGLRPTDIMPVMVWEGAVVVQDERVELPERVARFVKDFDGGTEVRPFRFSLPVKRWRFQL